MLSVCDTSKARYLQHTQPINATYCLLFRKLYENLNTLYGQNVECFMFKR